MKKSITVSLSLLILLLCVPLTTYAATARLSAIFANISFTGTTANCSATILADDSSDTISATMKLWNGSTCLATWTGTGKGSLSMAKSKAVTSGLEYKLTIDAVIDGSKFGTVSKFGTCP